MPLAFPSHMGFVAPLWRRWPDRFHVLGLCVGAAVPDVVDGVAGAFRGGLGQWYGHTLVGLFTLCLPTGLLLTYLLIHWGEHLAASSRPTWKFVGKTIGTWDNLAARRLGLLTMAVWIGAFSHLFIDFISHGNFLWFYPWYNNRHFFPSWWYIRWFEIPLPGYKNPYPFGPHLLVWIALSLIGIVMFFQPYLKRRRVS